MKVVHVVPHYQHGLGYEENHLGFAQAELGAQVSIVTSTELPHQWSGYVQDAAARKGQTGVEIDRGVTIRRLPPALQVRSRSQLLLRRLGETIKNESPDIIHLHAPVGVLTLQALKHARAQGLPAVIDSHINYFNLRPFNVVKRAYYQSFARVLLPYYRSVVKRFLPHTPDAETVLAKVLRIDSGLVTQTSLGADVSVHRFRPDARKWIAEEMGIGPGRKIVLFAGRVTPPKDIEVLVSACNTLWERHDLHVLLVGPVEESYRKALTTVCDPNHVHRLHFVGMKPNSRMSEYYSAADVGVWPGDPAVSILEAMACSLPVVLCRSDTTRHLITRDNGLPFDRGEPSALAAAVSEVLSDEGQRERMSGNSRSLAEAVFDWRVVANRTNQVYDEVLRRIDHNIPTIWESSFANAA